MRKIIKKVSEIMLFLMLVLLTVICCNPKIYYWEVYANDQKMYHQYERVINESQLDSLCIADTLNRDLSKWLVVSFYDDENGDKINKYVYIKQLDSLGEIIYNLEPQKDSVSYKIIKRITVNE